MSHWGKEVKRRWASPESHCPSLPEYGTGAAGGCVSVCPSIRVHRWEWNICCGSLGAPQLSVSVPGCYCTFFPPFLLVFLPLHTTLFFHFTKRRVPWLVYPAGTRAGLCPGERRTQRCGQLEENGRSRQTADKGNRRRYGRVGTAVIPSQQRATWWGEKKDWHLKMPGHVTYTISAQASGLQMQLSPV